MNYTEENIRNAFKAGLIKGNHKSYFDAPLDEHEYLTELKQVKNNIVLADVIKSVCGHPHTIGSFFGGNRYIVKCKDCGEEL